MKCHWQYMKLLALFRLSRRRTAVFLRLNLYLAKRDTLEKLRTLINYDSDDVSI